MDSDDNDFIEKHFVSHREDILDILYKAHHKGECLSITKIQDRSSTNYPNCHDIISSLVERGFVTKEDTGGRSKPVKLTDKGVKLAKVIHEKLSSLEHLSR